MKINCIRDAIACCIQTKTWKIMRICCFLMLLGIAQTWAVDSYSQQTRFTLKMDDTRVLDVLDEIEEQSEFFFVFNQKLLDVERKVSVDVKDKTIDKVMDRLFSDTGASYEIKDRLIVITTLEEKNRTLAAPQQKNVSGKVVDENGLPLPGVTVVVKGTARGTVTDIDGSYSITGIPESSVLVFSFVGMKSVEVQVEGKPAIDVTMEVDAIGLEEVVAIGYGVQKKSDVTGAMVSVSSEELIARPVNNAFEALQGRAAGVDITSNERPGEVGDIFIRGVRSLEASNAPLYVVDGIPIMSKSTIETINPRDIESVDILKDASATAIYGSRGANGVVIVTTKKGKEGRMELNYSGTFTFSNIVDKSPAMNASDYITWRRWAYYNSAPDIYAPGNAPTYDNDATIFGGVIGTDDPAYDNIMSGWASSATWDGSKVIDTDWTDFVTQTALTQDHTISASGGTKKMDAYVSFGYLDNKGTQKGQGYERYTGKVNVNVAPKEWVRIGGSLNASWSSQDYGYSRTGQASSSGPNTIYDAAKAIGRFARPYYDDGEIVLTPGNMGGNGSVYTVIDEWDKSEDQRQTARILGSFYALADFGEVHSALEGLTFKINFGPDYRNYRQGIYIDNNSAARLGSAGSYAKLANRRDFSWTLDQQLDYSRTFDKHKVAATLLHTSSSWNTEESAMSANNISKESFKWNAMGSVDITATESDASMSSGLTERALESYMARCHYAFDERYLLTLTGRWDGASQLAEGNKWDFFPSVSLAWRMEQEGFMQPVSFVNQMKIRFGVGVTGNSAVDPYQTLGGISSYYVPFGTGGGNTIAYTTNDQFYTKPDDFNRMANKDLGWEKTTQYNLGLDYGLFNGMVYGAIDVYRSNTNDLLMDMDISTITGYATTYANIGKTKNKGIDITLNVVPIKRSDITWELGISAAYQKDEIVELAYGKQDMVDNNWFIGQPLNLYYGYQCDGLWQESDAAEMAKFNDNGHDFEVGKVKPVDQYGDYAIGEEDRVVLGQKNPKWTVGFSSTVSFLKNFDFSFMMVGRMGYMVSTEGEDQLGLFQQREIDYWTPDNTGAKWQKPILSTSGGDEYSGLLGFKDASFLKMRNISLGYNVPGKACKKVGINNAKLYAQAINPFTVYSSVDWLDLDYGEYTETTATNFSTFNRSWVLGINIGF